MTIRQVDVRPTYGWTTVQVCDESSDSMPNAGCRDASCVVNLFYLENIVTPLTLVRMANAADVNKCNVLSFAMIMLKSK